MSAAEAIHAAEFILILIVIGLLGFLEILNMLLQKLGQTVTAWKGVRRAWRGGEQPEDGEDAATAADPEGPSHLPPR